MKKSWKQWMAITCALAMIVSLLPVTILAEEGVATPTDLAPVVEPVQETEPAEVPVEEPTEEPAKEEKVTYTARIAAAKRDGKIFLTAIVEPEYTGTITWEMKVPGQEKDAWVRIDSNVATLMILPGSNLIGKEIRFRLEDGTTSVLSYLVPALEPETVPGEGTDEPVVEINQEEPVVENETEPAAELTEETETEPETLPETIAEEPETEEEQIIEDYETPLGLDDTVETEPETTEEPGEEPAQEETVIEEENIVEVIEEIPAEEEPEAADEDLVIEIIEETPVQKEAPAAVKAEEPEAEAETEEIIDGLDIRENADGMSVIINTIPKDAEIDVLGVEGDWVLVETEGEQGYIYAEDLEAQAETEETEETAEEPEETEETEETVEEAEEKVIDTSNMKVTIFTSRRKVMKNGDPIVLTSKLDGFEGIEQINYQWYCDKGNGFEPVNGANNDSSTYTANSETLSWSWVLEVSF